MRVLVAEDKPRMARFLKRALQREGYAVELACDGEQALSMGLAGGVDLMVLDVMLPRRDGFDVIRNLREANQMLPTIMVTARRNLRHCASSRPRCGRLPHQAIRPRCPAGARARAHQAGSGGLSQGFK